MRNFIYKSKFRVVESPRDSEHRYVGTLPFLRSSNRKPHSQRVEAPQLHGKHKETEKLHAL